MDKKVLMICSQEIIRENNDGGKKCSYRNYELYKNIFGEKNVYLLMYAQPDGDSVNDGIQNIIRMPSHKNQIKKITDILKGNIFTSETVENRTIDFIEENEINIVALERSMYGSLVKKIKKKNVNCQIWVFVHNIEKNYFANKAKHQNFLFFIPYLIISRSEKETFRYSDYIMTLTERDAYTLKELYGKKCDAILPMTFRDTFHENKRIKKVDSICKHQLIFIGTFFPPNYDGIKWFVNNVMPELDDCELFIIGKNFEKKRKELERKNVVVIGSAESLEKYYYSNSVIVMPVFYGDGMKIKTAEAMMYGKTILASDEALVGYDVEGVSGIYRCNSKDEFVQSIRLVFAKTDYSYQEDIRNLFLKKYCLDNQIEKCRREWNIEK